MKALGVWGVSIDGEDRMGHTALTLYRDDGTG